MKSYDLKSEEYRNVITKFGLHRIDSPIRLFIREGGVTHRVQDSTGLVHCYAAPETGQSVIQWMPVDPTKPVAF